MHRILEIGKQAVLPSPESVLASMGRDANARVSQRIQDLLGQAMTLLSEAARPRAKTVDVTISEFSDIFAGEGANDPEAPLAVIYPDAVRLALFVATVGSEVIEIINDCFSTGAEALGAILDAAASLAADNAAAYVERSIANEKHDGRIDNRQTALRYSPGYCGWHISGQHQLFAHCKPVDIGVSLRECALMEPLKSVSGVIVVGPPGIHRFRPNYEFCSQCLSRICLGRMPEVR